MKKYVDGNVTKITMLNEELFELKIKVGDIAKHCVAGQFASLYVNDQSKILPRPISISEIDKENEVLTFVIQIVGDGTKKLSTLKVADKVSMLVPLGTGYDLDKVGDVTYLIGGGVGIPPLVEAYNQLKQKNKNVKVILGFRDTLFLTDKFEEKDLYVCTDSGSNGFKGNVVEFLKTIKNPNTILSCGPKPMLKGIVEYAKENDIDTQISMEERMACSVGVCLGCVINLMDNGKKVSKKVCVDGPVFRGEDICFE